MACISEIQQFLEFPERFPGKFPYHLLPFRFWLNGKRPSWGWYVGRWGQGCIGKQVTQRVVGWSEGGLGLREVREEEGTDRQNLRRIATVDALCSVKELKKCNFCTNRRNTEWTHKYLNTVRFFTFFDFLAQVWIFFLGLGSEEHALTSNNH